MSLIVFSKHYALLWGMFISYSLQTSAFCPTTEAARWTGSASPLSLVDAAEVVCPG